SEDELLRGGVRSEQQKALAFGRQDADLERAVARGHFVAELAGGNPGLQEPQLHVDQANGVGPQGGGTRVDGERVFGGKDKAASAGGNGVKRLQPKLRWIDVLFPGSAARKEKQLLGQSRRPVGFD